MKKLPLVLSTCALLALTACQKEEAVTQSDPQTAAASASSATPTPTPEATTATPTPTPEPTPEPTTEEPTPEPTTEEATPAEPVENFPGEYLTQDRVAYFVPEGYVRDETPSQPEIFVHQYTHYTTGDEALGRLMVGTPFTSPDGRSAEELEKEAVERLKPAWKINETVNTTSYTRPDGVKVIRSEVRFASGNNPGYIYTIDNGVEMLHAAILIEQSDSTEFLEKIENSIGIIL